MSRIRSRRGRSRRVNPTRAPAGSRNRAHQAPKPPALAHKCGDCGREILAGQRRCADCHATANTARLREHQAATTLRRRNTGEHPSARVEVRARVASAQRAHGEARREESASGFTGRPSEFRRLILPKLQAVTPSRLARATGLSPGYAAQIRNGTRTPHPRHWAALHLAGLQANEEAPGRW
jgi:hypothetical protein